MLLAPGPRQARSMAPIGPVCCLDSTPIFTFSKVVRALNIREVWNVRATPEAVHLVGLPPDRRSTDGRCGE